VSFVLDRYGHLFPEADTALRARLDLLFRGATQHGRLEREQIRSELDSFRAV
jgi:hypothetical protein